MLGMLEDLRRKLSGYTQRNQPDIQIPLTHPALAEFRDCISELVQRGNSPSQPIASITLIGAVFHETAVGGSFSMRDRRWIRLTLAELGNRSYSLAPHAKLICPNIVHNKRDFLDDSLNFQTDVVVVCFVLDPLSEPTRRFLNQERYPYLPPYSVSPYHRDHRSWPDAVHRAGARLVITFSQNTGMEIAARNFTGPDFCTVGSAVVSAPLYTDLSFGLKIMPCVNFVMDTLTVKRPEAAQPNQTASTLTIA